MTDEIVVELRAISDQKARKAKATITLDTIHGELTIHHISVIHQDGKGPWVALPRIDFTDKHTGEFRHLDVFHPGARLKRAISDAVLAEYDKLGTSKE